MKKITKYLIIPLFSIFAFFLLFNTKISATGVLVPDDGSGDSSGDITIVDPSAELFQSCHDYITTNIISSESLTEALNGKIYANFTQEDCMEMINIASKREVIKNILNVEDVERIHTYTSAYASYFISIPSTTLDAGTYTFSLKVRAENTVVFNKVMLLIEYDSLNVTSFYTYLNTEYQTISRTITITESITINRLQFQCGDPYGTIYFKDIMLEKGSTATRYVSYDYHREYYEEGIDYADGRVNTNSTSYTQGVTDADNRVNTDSVNYKTGVSSGYEKATKDGKSLGTFIPNLLGGFGSFFLTILNIDILGFNLLTVFGIIVAVAGVIIILKIVRG